MKKQSSQVWPYTEMRQSIETKRKPRCWLVLIDKDTKSTFINLFKDIKKTIPKELRCKNNFSQKNINKETEIIYKKTNKNSRFEKYNNENKQFTRGAQ